MSRTRVRFSLSAIILLFAAASAMPPLSASPTPISLTTTNGTVPGTGITYTISNTGGTPRNIFPAGTSDQNLWSWTSFPEFLAAGTPISLAVTFSAPIPANRLVWGANSVTPPSTTRFTPSGGTASAADFNLTDGISAVLARGPASYNASTGTITANSQDVSLMVGSSSTNTLASFTISATNNSTDGYTVFFGFTSAPASGTTGALFTYNGFANKTGLTLIGSAATTSTADGTVLRLTPATSSQSGAAYSTTPVRSETMPLSAPPSSSVSRIRAARIRPTESLSCWERVPQAWGASVLAWVTRASAATASPLSLTPSTMLVSASATTTVTVAIMSPSTPTAS